MSVAGRLLLSSIRPPVGPLELTPPQVPRVSDQRQFVPGVSAELITSQSIDYEVEDPCIGLD